MGLSFSNHLIIHLFSIIASPALKVTRGAGANLIYPQANVGLHPSRNFITGPHREITIGTRTRTHSCSQSRAQFLDGGKKLENLRKTHTDPGRTCKLHSKRPQAWAHPRNLTDYSLVDNQSCQPKRSSLGSYVADKKKTLTLKHTIQRLMFYSYFKSEYVTQSSTLIFLFQKRDLCELFLGVNAPCKERLQH